MPAYLYQPCWLKSASRSGGCTYTTSPRASCACCEMPTVPIFPSTVTHSCFSENLRSARFVVLTKKFLETLWRNADLEVLQFRQQERCSMFCKTHLTAAMLRDRLFSAHRRFEPRPRRLKLHERKLAATVGFSRNTIRGICWNQTTLLLFFFFPLRLPSFAACRRYNR